MCISIIALFKMLSATFYLCQQAVLDMGISLKEERWHPQLKVKATIPLMMETQAQTAGPNADYTT